MVPVPGVEVEEGMKFVQYKTEYDKSPEKNPWAGGNNESIITIYKEWISRLHELGNDDNASTMLMVANLELRWYLHGRPFYNLYPAGEEAFKQSNFSNKTLQFFGDQCIESWNARCQTAEGEERVQTNKYIFPPSLAVNTTEESWLVGFYTDFLDDGRRYFQMNCCLYWQEQDAKFAFFLNHDNCYESSDPGRIAVKEMLSPLAVCMFLYMTGDTEFAERLLLSKDEKRHPRGEDYERAVERAIRRGKNGWSIGKNWDSIPHFRRPHFGIRWTGKGGKIPKLVPIKGSFVKRSELTKVPTGYLDRK